MYSMPWDAGHCIAVAIYAALTSYLDILTLRHIVTDYVGIIVLPRYADNISP
jgi:hypothetical protein